MPLETFLSTLGEEIIDADEETFLLFSNQTGSRNLGMVDPHARTLDFSVAGRDVTIHQSPGLLTSNRSEGTTGAVVWKITPLFAEWMASSNVLFEHDILNENSSVLELGAGVAGLVGLIMSPKIARYILTDQEYVVKLLKQNIEENATVDKRSSSKPKRGQTSRGIKHAREPEVLVLDWELSILENLPNVLCSWQSCSTVSGINTGGLDVVVACDCIFNEALIEPFVNTCAGLCHFPRGNSAVLCIVAQQLRSPEVFQTWLEVMSHSFRLWRIPEEQLTRELTDGAGFVVHVALLRRPSN